MHHETQPIFNGKADPEADKQRWPCRPTSICQFYPIYPIQPVRLFVFPIFSTPFTQFLSDLIRHNSIPSNPPYPIVSHIRRLVVSEKECAPKGFFNTLARTPDACIDFPRMKEGGRLDCHWVADAVRCVSEWRSLSRCLVLSPSSSLSLPFIPLLSNTAKAVLPLSYRNFLRSLADDI
ncbi:hypothetical protein VTI28DRAFT_5621 [Corynascus sepedonium]